MVKKTLIIIGSVVLVCVVLTNGLVSQIVSPLFPAITYDKDPYAVISFLKTIRTNPEFDSQMEVWRDVYGEQLEEKVHEDDKNRLETIRSLEAILKQNPKSTSVLFNLGAFYKEQGDEAKASYYFNQAFQIDPWLKKN
ncbi:hypothetical protein A3D80_01680 [Candidatus Roizmanbacteria bacterium RIFCSPHIGHO2_02_FULL_40_13b]|uniref:Uncharacterized protein n=1 Tax=Candidatus Roizmanbacteria bacterium RIFCSPHIGHO2_01_FULL_39_24 TaxID=1802032 RepID=A0A1F7GHT4_9BACT|nr:MAG: hypothetical protein A2799_02955 [Candidatus Roizmanbacteria bacterium RIFCSPHIGHO2_01_FULL_39_24]OGK26860.1 MAG: hypothetical protein A3D80_01680 [Candidatus Roizmanbacteria bacterium RIFCSPHIGHO2_02_FULL_40_13b]OGK49752.1 MAG: hypothetical protein A3A56_00460 [Candidatus Roizmanbacteria bacterium RIFCSPLOWO2_01_FULL_40_32]OGK57408.1 MAG: hypothetical protein A3H83_04145 [Candidatus Roizmanbacteria bacterium RIFCSPLOWO2_02_FULL_39_8]